MFHDEIHVETDKESYIFTCIDEKCTDVSNEGWTYSRYSEEKPILPLNDFICFTYSCCSRGGRVFEHRYERTSFDGFVVGDSDYFHC